MSLSPEEFDRIFPGWEVWANGKKIGLVARTGAARDGLYLEVEIESPVERAVCVPFRYVGGVEAGRVHLTLSPDDLASGSWTAGPPG